ncbi:MAG: DUF3052 domain-containing protein [Gemmatimonadaceae bacterium]
MTTLRRGRTRVPGRALLETDHVLFRAEDERVKVPLSAIRTVKAEDGVLQLTTPDGTISLEPGAAAARWLDRIRNPRSLLDKLGVKSGMRVAVINVEDAGFDTRLRARTSDVHATAKPATDVIFFGAESAGELGKLATLRCALVPNGAIWVVHRKGRAATLRDVDVFAAAKRAGLVDNKVASFSDTHTAERLVIPVASRGAKVR